MIDVPLIDELREVRRRLSESCQGDVKRYAAMLGDVARTMPGNYVSQPLLPQAKSTTRADIVEVTDPA